jgi:hypothetical protein
MGTELVPETLEDFNILTRLLVRENFIEFSRCENIKSYTESHYVHCDSHAFTQGITNRL